jgi:multiple sugar transport system permease protein
METRRFSMPARRRRASPARIATHALLWMWSAVCLLPLYWLGIASIKSPADLDGSPRYLPFADFAPTLDAWRFILADPAENLLRAAFNSLAIATMASIICVTAASLALYGLTRCPGRRGPAGQGLILTIMLAVRAVPPVVIALPIYVLAGLVGLLDSVSLLTGVYAAINLPVAVWLLAPVLGDRPSEQEEAARLDGATHPEVLFGILMPMVRLQVAAAGFLIFLLCWNEYLLAAYLAADHAQTLTPWMVGQLSMKEAQAGGEGEELSRMAAAAIFMAAPAVLLAALVQHRLARSFLRRNGS